jgi:hypothetical protein
LTLGPRQTRSYCRVLLYYYPPTSANEREAKASEVEEGKREEGKKERSSGPYDSCKRRIAS